VKDKSLSNTLPIEYNVLVIEDNKPAATWLVLINQALNGTADADADANVFQHEPSPSLSMRMVSIVIFIFCKKYFRSSKKYKAI
jgi:hypothetical protein